MVSSQRVAIRYVTASVADKMESALADLTNAHVVNDLGILRTLLEHVSRQTRINNPGISQQAHSLSRVFDTAHKFVKDEVLNAVHSTRELLETALF